MKQNTDRPKPISQLAALLLVVCNLTAAVAATPAGTKVNPTISNTQTIELIGGSTENVTWTAPKADTYKLWVQIPSPSTAINATYHIYPQGNAVGNTSCSSTDPTYPCFQASVDQATATNGWAQLMLNNKASTSWVFTKTGYVSTNASGIPKSQQLGIAQVSFQSTVTPPPVFTIGQSYQGGIIFYIDSSKQHGLIAPLLDQVTQPPGIEWYYGINLTIGTGTAIGTGQANTAAIVKAQGLGNYAAKLCDDLVLNGYSDWYLPSKDELNQLYLNKAVVGGFASYTAYWSSSEFDSNGAWYQYFDDGRQVLAAKQGFLAARCIRSF